MSGDGLDRHAYEMCVMVELRNALRAGDVWVRGGRRYRALDDDLLPMSTAAVLRVASELDSQAFLDERCERLTSPPPCMTSSDWLSATACLGRPLKVAS